MTFAPASVNGREVIAASGRIGDETPQAFAAFLARLPGGGRGVTVYLDSQGGGVEAAMELGSAMRRIGATAVVARVEPGLFGQGRLDKAECFSACVYALMGARRRIVPPHSEVGIHRMYLAAEGYGDVTAYATPDLLAQGARLRSALKSYASRMGVSPGLIAQAEQTKPPHFHILTRAEIAKWHLAATM